MRISALKLLSWLGLALTLVPSLFVFSGALSLDAFKAIVLAGSVLWLSTAPFGVPVVPPVYCIRHVSCISRVIFGAVGPCFSNTSGNFITLLPGRSETFPDGMASDIFFMRPSMVGARSAMLVVTT